ncbi:phosphonate C-P lyase system protein PhnH [Photobacterium frigidiphilum]|uniref:Phosphonate C-P lyase system protein PhnH n=1 Tax=Photobacterium frigidiphilum TaxID=264736 RepID=A0A2T3JNF3_9GAMM|nr:phosphonate C-P lyase system protein PhnH [Photobacterium frigidiphilum]PSU50565.1 phosphonate C-P lyase system protein PhnH [Photobacterium frigidiphilum]
MNMISPAFSDAVHDSQICFRRLLKAMSEPGECVELDRINDRSNDHEKGSGFGIMMSACTQTLLTLADNTTPLWLSPSFIQDKAVIDNLTFHIGAQITQTADSAAFAAVSYQDSVTTPWLTLPLCIGNEEYPDRSTTVIVETDSLSNGVALTLTGPGIEQARDIHLGQLPDDLLNLLLQRQHLPSFPLGLDFIFVSGQHVIAIPRSTLLEISLCM